MRQAEADVGREGADLALGEADLERLLDRRHVLPGDVAAGGDAGAGGRGVGSSGKVHWGRGCERYSKALLNTPRGPPLAALPTPANPCASHPMPPPAAALLGEVRAGNAAHMTFEAAAEDKGEGGGKAAGMDAGESERQ